jgi:hypothetical protein
MIGDLVSLRAEQAQTEVGASPSASSLGMAFHHSLTRPTLSTDKDHHGTGRLWSLAEDELTPISEPLG